MLFQTLLLISSLQLNSHLPPLIKWEGSSENLMQLKGPLTTDFELTEGMTSPDYLQSMKFIDRLVAANPTQFSSVIIGKSSSGRAIKMMIAQQKNATKAHELLVNKPTILIQGGIHSGEIDGKDAGFMLLRDIATGKKRGLLNKVNILFIPILNVDGHERSSEYNRINQRGPIKMGFRTNGKNLNLNRDYTKLDTPEVRAVMEVMSQYKPDLYVDVHVTDGADYQYDITYGSTPSFASETPEIAKILETQFQEYIDEKLETKGHIPGPLVFVKNKREFNKGLVGWVATPRYSNGWGDLAGVPSILVENHSLKPYKQRVLGTYVFLEAAIDALYKYHGLLINAVKKENNFLPKKLIVERAYSTLPDYIPFKGIEYKKFTSSLSGQEEVSYLGKKYQYKALPIYWKKEIVHEVIIPSTFYIPPAYSHIIKKLKLHGIQVTRLNQEDYSNKLHEARVSKYQFAKMPFEGRFRVNASFEFKETDQPIEHTWFKVNTAQMRGELATHLLHPEAPDSFFSWGEFNTIFQRTEYVENYALEPYARKMFDNKPELKKEFDQKLIDDISFAKSASKRLAWIYSKTPFYDKGYLKYPILFSFKEK